MLEVCEVCAFRPWRQVVSLPYCFHLFASGSKSFCKNNRISVCMVQILLGLCTYFISRLAVMARKQKWQRWNYRWRGMSWTSRQRDGVENWTIRGWTNRERRKSQLQKMCLLLFASTLHDRGWLLRTQDVLNDASSVGYVLQRNTN